MPAQLPHTPGESVMTKVAIVEDSDTLRQYLADLIGGTPGTSAFAPAPQPRRRWSKFRCKIPTWC